MDGDCTICAPLYVCVEQADSFHTERCPAVYLCDVKGAVKMETSEVCRSQDWPTGRDCDSFSLGDGTHLQRGSCVCLWNSHERRAPAASCPWSPCPDEHFRCPSDRKCQSRAGPWCTASSPKNRLLLTLTESLLCAVSILNPRCELA